MAAIDDETKRRFKRRLRRRRSDAIALSQLADQKLERLLIRRFGKLISVRRFIGLWVVLFLLLILSNILQARNLSTYYQTLQPVPGGLYTEGIIGTFTNANPMFASGAVDTAVSHLVYYGLFKNRTPNNLVAHVGDS